MHLRSVAKRLEHLQAAAALRRLRRGAALPCVGAATPCLFRATATKGGESLAEYRFCSDSAVAQARLRRAKPRLYTVSTLSVKPKHS